MLARIDSTTPKWYLTDRQGSVRIVFGNSAVIEDEVNYDGFGNATQTNPTKLGHYAFTGREIDVETQLQFNRERYYDPLTGRWITRDPEGFDAGDSNLYRYVNNAPTDSVDPSGLERISYDLLDDGVYWQIQEKGQFYNSNLNRIRIGRLESTKFVGSS